MWARLNRNGPNVARPIPVSKMIGELKQWTEKVNTAHKKYVKYFNIQIIAIINNATMYSYSVILYANNKKT